MSIGARIVGQNVPCARVRLLVCAVKWVGIIIIANGYQLRRVYTSRVKVFRAGRLKIRLDNIYDRRRLLMGFGCNEDLAGNNERYDGAEERDNYDERYIFLFHNYFTTFSFMFRFLAGW